MNDSVGENPESEESASRASGGAIGGEREREESFKAAKKERERARGQGSAEKKALDE